jgi:putative heme iron utilization protein
MADPLTPEVSERICKHMNEDHGDAIVLYAKVFGKIDAPTSAQMLSIDSNGMDLTVVTVEQTNSVRIPFERPLNDSEDAHQVLIAMVKQARSQG